MKSTVLLLSLLLSLTSCVHKHDYAVGALNNCLLAENYSEAIKTIGTPSDAYIDAKGDGMMKWYRSKDTTIITQNPLYVNTNTSVRPTNFSRTLEIATSTSVSGGGIDAFTRTDSCAVFMTVRNLKIESYIYAYNGFDRLSAYDSNLFQTNLFFAAEDDNLKYVSAQLANNPEYATPENLTRLAIVAARARSEDVTAWLLQNYHLDVDKKVRMFTYNGSEMPHIDSRRGSTGRYEGTVSDLSIADVAVNLAELQSRKLR